MKITLKLVLAITALALCSNISAQTLKLAHIDMQELIEAMPEYDSAMVKMQRFVQVLEEELDLITTERNKKLEEYTKNQANWTDLVRQSRGDEITGMNQRIQVFQEQAQESIQVEQNKLMQPVIEKANKALDKVAMEQGVTYVISSNTQILLFKAPGTLDLLPAVKKQLGITK